MNTLKQFIKFGLVGVSNTVIGYLIYALSLKGMRLLNLWPSYDIYIAQFIMFVLSVAWSYFWNNRFVFKGNVKTKKDIVISLLKTYATYAFTSLFLSEVLLMFWVRIIGINEYIAPVLNLLITVPLNFLLQKYWAFKKRPDKEDPALKNIPSAIAFRHRIYLAVIYSAAHLMLCLISGQWWDDWCYWINGPELLISLYSASGIPMQAYYILSVMWLPEWGYRIVVFVLFLLVALIFYEILRQMDIFSEDDAFFIAAVAMTVPVNDARTVLNCYAYTVEIFLFMCGFLLATKIKLFSGAKKYLIHAISLVLLVGSYSMESLLVFTGMIWVYLLYDTAKNNMNAKPGRRILLFFRSFWDYLVLPFAFFVLKRIFFKPYGAYAQYNQLTKDSLITGLSLSPKSAFFTGVDIGRSYIAQAGLIPLALVVAAIAGYLVFKKIQTKDNGTEKGSQKKQIKKWLLILALGLVTYFAGIFAYVVIRKGATLAVTTVDSRDVMLAGFGIAVFIVAVSRLIPVKRTFQNLLPIVFIVLGIFHFNEWYLNYQEDWYQQKVLASVIEEYDGFGQDNTIYCYFSEPSIVATTRIYTVNGISYTVTGKMEKLYFTRISDLQYGYTEHDFSGSGFNCDDYDTSDMTIDGVLFINVVPVSDSDLIRMRIHEIT
ncbi:MAG: GtrA family protein, partial [Clostridiales bacterium]|nr:GtrA family protein [Clostridiales bacterium]